jgi:perosamine synthetase
VYVIPVYKPYLTPDILIYARQALASGWIARGEYLDKVTDLLREIFGFKHVLLTNSGTSAGHLVAIALKHADPGLQYIYVPNNVYVAAWNTLLQEFPANKIVAVDACLDTWNAQAETWTYPLDESRVAILAVHNLGNVVNVPALQLKFPRALIVEDACEGLFGTYDGRSVGSASIASAFSFHANKTLTSGEGGAFVTADRDLFDLAHRVSNQGATCEKYVHDIHGYNYRMTNVQAALLYGQLLYREEILSRKKIIFAAYAGGLSGVKGVHLQQTESGTTSANWMLGVRVEEGTYERAAKHFGDAGIEIRPMFPPIVRHAHLRDVQIAYGPGESPCQNAILLAQECFMVPSYPGLLDDEVVRVIKAVRSYAEAV